MNTSLACLVVVVAATLARPVAADEPSDRVKRGEYVFRAADCYSCHTDTENHGPPLAGGRSEEHTSELQSH